MPAANMALYMAQRRKKRRAELIAMSGGKCVKCESKRGLEFDHVDAKAKLFRLTGKGLDGPWEQIVEEWLKCQLLCGGCHSEKTKKYKDKSTDPWNKTSEHGTEGAYNRGCRCAECRTAKYEGRVRRKETSGERGMNLIPV